jgi:hypothetical protein
MDDTKRTSSDREMRRIGKELMVHQLLAPRYRLEWLEDRTPNEVLEDT